MKSVDMRFGIIREKHTQDALTYHLDGEYCPRCRMPTEIGLVENRRYCTNKQCCALILGKP